ncbi:MAG: group II intron maturase-specific domain-containing protein [Gemmatimonadaceae bacterium]
MSGDVHVRFCESGRGRFPPATHRVIHCATKAQAEQVLSALAERIAEVGLELHPDKTRIVYCKDANRTGSSEHEQFTFLGYTFRPRLAKNRRGQYFVAFLPAVSNDAGKAIRQEIRSWRINVHSDKSLADIASFVNPIVRGWCSY